LLALAAWWVLDADTYEWLRFTPTDAIIAVALNARA